jgi:hypothetical protein
MTPCPGCALTWLMLRSTPFYYLLLLSSLPATAQQSLQGRVKRRQSTEILPAVSVINRTLGTTNRSDLGGNYRIAARPGDTLIFSSAGYLPDTTRVVAWMFDEKNGFDIYLRPNVISLPSALVDESSRYQLDSLQRRDDYAWIYRMHPDAALSDTNFTQGFGISFDINFFNERQKEKRRLRRRLAQEEKDYYIDFRCPSAWVERITGLRDDSLRYFLLHYRPSYDFCRKASYEDIFLYINDHAKIFRHPTSPRRGKRRSSAAPHPSGSTPKPAPASSPVPGSAAIPRKAHIDPPSIAGSDDLSL